MELTSKFLLLLFVYLGQLIQVSCIPSAGLLELKDSNFSQIVDIEMKNDFILLEFYAPWCGHCMRLAKLLEDVLPSVESKMKIGKIDITENKNTADRFGVKSFPTVKYYHKGVYGDFEGPRDAEGIIAFANRMTTPNPMHVTSSTDLTDTLLKDNVTFLFIGNANFAKVNRKDEIFGSSLTDWAIAFSNATYSNRELLTAGYMSWSDAATIYPQISPPADIDHGFAIARIERNVKPFVFDQGLKISSLKKWIKTNNHRLITPLNRNNYKFVSDVSEKWLAVVVIDQSSSSSSGYIKQLSNELEDAMTNSPVFHSRLAVGYLDGVEWGEYLKDFGIQADMLPQVYVFNARTKEFYQNSSLTHQTPQEIMSFCLDVLDGKYPAQSESWVSKITKHFKSLGVIGGAGIAIPVIMLIGAFIMKPADPDAPKKKDKKKRD